MEKDSKDQEEYISLSKASENSPYSQEYLSLRARKGKLKAIKLGKNWATKKEWINEYVAEAQSYRENLNHRIEKKETERILGKEKKAKQETQVKVSESESKLGLPATSSIPEKQLGLRFDMVVALAFLVLISSIAFGQGGLSGAFKDVKEVFSNVAQKSEVVLISISKEIRKGGAEINLVLNQSLLPIEDKSEFIAITDLVYPTTIWQETGHVFSSYFNWLKDKLGNVFVANPKTVAWEKDVNRSLIVESKIDSLTNLITQKEIDSLKGASVLESSNPRVYADIGRMYLATGQKEEERVEFEKVMAQREDYGPANINWVLMLEYEGREEEAIAKWEWFLSRVPNDVEVLFHLGRLYYNNDLIDKAIGQFVAALSLSPNYSNARYFLAIAYEKQGKTDQALEQLNIISGADPANQEIKDRIQRLRIGMSEPKEKMELPEEKGGEKEEGILNDIE